ncbi:MAG: hypothetical protein HYY06_07165 [Deltaproteobacteria bacterium]|nr:hypothetical protein [Deltaproteobacteria bacterium]
MLRRSQPAPAVVSKRPDPPPGLRCSFAARDDFEARRLLVPLAGGTPVPVEIALPQIR